MTENIPGAHNEAHEDDGLEDLTLEDEAADDVVGGDTTQTAPPEYRGRYQLKLGEAGGLLGGG